MSELQRLKNVLKEMSAYEQDLEQRIQARRAEEDRKWAEWMDTPEALVAVIINPDLAIRPSQRVYSGKQILEMIREKRQ